MYKYITMKTKKLLLNSLPLLLVGGVMAYAAAPTGGYLPNATLDPNCAPWDTDCFVQVAPELTSVWDNVDGTVANETSTDINYMNGNIGIGTTTPLGVLSIQKDATNGNEWYIKHSVARDAGFWGGFHFFRSRGTHASPLSVQEGDRLVYRNNLGYDGSAFQSAAVYTTYVDGLVSAGIVPWAHSFDVTNNSGSLLDAVDITSNGNIGFGTNDPSDHLTLERSGDWSGIQMLHYKWTGTSHPYLVMRSDGWSKANPGNLLQNQTVGAVVSRVNQHPWAGASIYMRTEEDHDVTSAGTNMTLATTGLWKITAQERMRISADGNVGIWTNTPEVKLDVAWIESVWAEAKQYTWAAYYYRAGSPGGSGMEYYHVRLPHNNNTVDPVWGSYYIELEWFSYFWTPQIINITCVGYLFSWSWDLVSPSCQDMTGLAWFNPTTYIGSDGHVYIRIESAVNYQFNFHVNYKEVHPILVPVKEGDITVINNITLNM